MASLLMFLMPTCDGGDGNMSLTRRDSESETVGEGWGERKSTTNKNVVIQIQVDHRERDGQKIR